jgi:hypothetical protein
MHVFDRFTKQPREAPMVLSVLQRNAQSDVINIAKEVGYAPNLLLPGLLEASCAAACLRMSLSIGSRRQARTNDAKSGESGQPWLTPSFIRCVHHDP